MTRQTAVTFVAFLFPILLHAACDPASGRGFFPPKLTEEGAARPDLSLPPVDRGVASKCADLDGDGSNESLVGLYSNGVSGVLRVMRKDGDSWAVVAEAETVSFFEPQLELQDLDGDNRPEIVTIAGFRPDAKEYGIFRWTGDRLVDMSPAMPERETNPDLGTVEFLDLNGDGRLEYLAHHRCAEPPCAIETFAMNAEGSYAYWTSPLYLEIFTRAAGKPKTERSTFDVPSPAGAYDLIIASPATKRLSVASATVRLNGTVIARPDDFKNSGTMLRFTSVPLLPSNAIEVELRGAPGAEVVITIVPHE